MPESVDQTLLPPPESSPVSRIITRVKNAVHRHTPEGRREEYREKWSHVLENAKGLPRFELERRLTEEANKYARDRVIRDVLIVTALTGGAVAGAIGVNTLRKKDWNLSKLFTDLGVSVRNHAESVVTKAAEMVTTSAIKGATESIANNPNLVSDLAQRAAHEAIHGTAKAVEANREIVSNLAANVTTDALRSAEATLASDPTLIGNIITRGTEQASDALRTAAASDAVQTHLKDAGSLAAQAVMRGATEEVTARASALPDRIKQGFWSFIASVVPGKK